jgi:hypothetical protein
VNSGKIPDGLNAKETERFLREQGAEICGFRGTQDLGEPSGRRGRDNWGREWYEF